ncbi:flavodoxin family protein [Lactococcus garvieae]|uniref:flavodoxin family protein n=1 Tax=Lactococcus garvieae TaxID=1363 RepID=UPI00288DC357|nr:flavodoxin family protein [Lactococcus garvieae]MDT2741256.1 flavodoxin family protein [Lactococcus garvieae]
MKYAVRYASRGGNTRAVADEIAKKIDVKAERISEPLEEEVDVLFLGAGVWFASVTKDMKEYLAALDSGKIKQIVAFSTSGHLESAIKKITAAAKDKGIKVNAESFDLHLNMQGMTFFAPAGGDLTKEQINEVDGFVDKVLAKL